jgi:hypothetical protein
MEIAEFSQIIPENFVEIGYTSLKDVVDLNLTRAMAVPGLDGGDFEDELELEPTIENGFLKPITLLNPGEEVPVFGVDTSNIDLGETKEGFLCAIRGSIVWRENKAYQYVRHGPFIFHITEANKHFLYNALRQRCFDVNEGVGAPILERIPEHIRNILERWLQKQLSESCRESLLLWDGSLTTRTVNSPISVLSSLLKRARDSHNVVLALSKKTSISAFGRRMDSLIDTGDAPCLLDIDDVVRVQYGKYLRFFGKIYAAKLSPGNLSFRLDIDRRVSQTAGVQAVENLLRSDLIVDSYPETLRLAHVLSRFSANEVLAMQRYVAENYGLKVIRRPNVRQILFGPYGGIASRRV